MGRSRQARIGPLAERDLENILIWTRRQFGAAQARAYHKTLRHAIRELLQEPFPIDSRAREDLMPGARTLHVARKGRHGSHLLVYRVVGNMIDIARILHDRMDLSSHFEADD
jgi:toxin ParE1/3/4